MNRLVSLIMSMAVLLLVLPFVAKADELLVLDGKYWLERMQEAYKNNNFELFLVRASAGNLEPVRFTHGILNNHAYTHWYYLNGMPNGFLTNGDNTIYFIDGKKKLVMPNHKDPVFFTRLQTFSLEKRLDFYDVTLLGKFRIINRDTISIGLSPKHNDRFIFTLWIDEETGSLVQLQVIEDKDGIKESFLGVNLKTFKKPNDLIIDLSKNIYANQYEVTPIESTKNDLNWSLDYIPYGFKQFFSKKYVLENSNIPVEHVMFSDGFVEFSVYKIPAIGSMDFQVVKEGSVNLYRRLIGDEKIVIIGELPLAIEEQIARGYRVK